jgi:uncharacterized protein with PIN domain
MQKGPLICDRCHAGQMVEYSRTVGTEKKVTIKGTRCERCGFTLLDDDEAVWAAV